MPILMYHAVESAPRPPKYKHFYVLAKEFAGHMRMLRRTGYTAITFAALEAARKGEGPLPPKPVLLTFDDGYQNLRCNVHPLLRELGFPYTVFLVSERVGKTNDWVAAEGYEPTPLLTWEDILEMQEDGGVNFQSHTAAHPKMAELSEAEARREIMSAKDALEQRLGRPMTTLCYPYGSHNDMIRQLAREAGHTMAVTTDFGRARREDDPLRLPRISVYHVPPVSLTYGIGSLNFRWRLESRKDTRE
ncbi:MAG: polysaccharide deacetylase family protein [Armatimonadetes bacterium]|nr:polysaccharide deacetylase family protein [Armatimonadota bacterium]